MCSGSGKGDLWSSVETGVFGSIDAIGVFLSPMEAIGVLWSPIEAIGVLWSPMEAVVASSSSCSMARAGGGGSWSISTSL